MSETTLESLKARVEAKYAPYVVNMGEAGKAVLVQSLRLGDKKLAELTATQREFNKIQQPSKLVDENGDNREPTEAEAEELEEQALKLRPQMIELCRKMIRIPAENEAYVDKLLALAGDDLPMLLTIVEEYSESSQLGEASASPSS